jgi:hypothetical protein
MSIVPTIGPSSQPTSITFAQAHAGERTSLMVAAQRAKTLVAERSWDEIFDPAPEPTARRVFRQAVAEVANNARTALPACEGRVDLAVKIVLAGDVDVLPDGTAEVASQSDAGLIFHVNGECECKDFPKAPQGWCKHRLALALHKRATALTTARLDAPVGERNGQTPAPPALPEAPASVNVFVDVQGRKVQFTLRDTDEARLLERLEALLQRFPSGGVGAGDQEPPEGWCHKHNCQMTKQSNEKGSWWSHKLAGGIWCKGK